MTRLPWAASCVSDDDGAFWKTSPHHSLLFQQCLCHLKASAASLAVAGVGEDVMKENEQRGRKEQELSRVNSGKANRAGGEGRQDIAGRCRH